MAANGKKTTIWLIIGAMTLYWSVVCFYKRLSQGKEGALSDLYFDDEDCKFMSPDWITPEEQLSVINGIVMKNDTFICLGDVGKSEYIKDITARKKILILGNHDAMDR